MRKLITLAISLLALAAVALPTAAMAKGVERVQCETTPTTAKFSVTQPADFRGTPGGWVGTWTHVYEVTVNPDGSFKGTGAQSNDVFPDMYKFTETIEGKFVNGTVSFEATRNEDSFVYSAKDAPTDGTTETLATTKPVVEWDVVITVSTVDITEGTAGYMNHGDYVSSNGGGADAAHDSCGMPVNSNKNKTK